MMPRAMLPEKVKSSADAHIAIYKSLLEPNREEISQILLSLSDKDTTSIAEDYRVKCIIKKESGKTEILYFNTIGDFLFHGKTYHNDSLKNEIFSFIPECLK
ncbi:hypothetical protein ACTHGU_03585 [Chitinophagaceae bacterium MMS25-I14]